MTGRAQPRLFPAFAGIALADILANSVAIVIILIVITIATKNAQEQERLAEVEDVSVLLSRDLATSVVMNGLPTSAPARLHDYRNSPLDRVLNFQVMPIVELHADFVRDYYSKRVFRREELLKQNNAFDRFLATMTPNQKARMRVDIYDVRMFYIAMSIIRQHHGRLPGHWHFIGYHGKAPAPGADWTATGGEPAQEAAEDPPLAEPGEGQTDDGSRYGGKAWEAFPQDTDLSGDTAQEPYPFDDLAWDAKTPAADLPGDNRNGQDEQSRRSDAMFNALSQLMGQAMNPGRQRGRTPAVIRFRTAVPSGNKSPDKKNNEIVQTSRNGGKNRIDYTRLLAALFGFMQKAQNDADNGRYLTLERFDFRRDVLAPAATAQLPRNSKQLAFLKRLGEQVQHAFDGHPLDVSQTTAPHLADNQLALELNQPLKKAVLAGNERQEQLGFLPGEADVTGRLGLYPAIYKGLQASLEKETLVLMPPAQQDPRTYRWRVATFVSPERDDYLIAYIYSAIDGDGRLLLPTDENGIRVNEVSWMTYRPPVRHRKEREMFLAYGIAAALLILGLLRRFGRLPFTQ